MAPRKSLTHAISSSSLVLVAVFFAGVWFLYSSPPPTGSAKRPAHVQHAPAQHIDHSAQTPIQSTQTGAFTKRLVVVGDIHGDLPHATKLLRTLGLLNLKSEWAGGDAILVQTGGASLGRSGATGPR